MCTTTRSNVVWAYGETVDTPVLGTGLARGESSNLSTPTKKLDTLMDTFLTNWIRQGRKGVLVVLRSRRYVSLRNYHHTFFFSQVGNRIVITHLFSKINRCTCAIVSYPIVSFLSYQALVQQKIRRMFTLCPTY